MQALPVSSRWTVIAVVVALAAASAAARGETVAKLTTADGVHRASFPVPGGRIEVILPDDFAAGDSVLGTVRALPGKAGPSGDALVGWVVELRQPGREGLVRSAVADGVLAWEVAAPRGGGGPSLSLRRPNGREVARVALPGPAPPPQAVSGECLLPRLGEAGKTGQIAGRFEGGPEASRVSLSGRPLRVLARSPRKLVFEIPADARGAGRLELQAGDARASGELRVVAVVLSALETTLLKGQRTTMTLTVHGLAGLAGEVPLQLENATGSVVSLEGGESQLLWIGPGDLVDGHFTRSYALESRRSGEFVIHATLPFGLPKGEGAPPPRPPIVASLPGAPGPEDDPPPPPPPPPRARSARCETTWQHDTPVIVSYQALYDASCKWALGNFISRAEKLGEWKRSGGTYIEDPPGQYWKQVATVREIVDFKIQGRIRAAIESERLGCPPPCRFSAYHDEVRFFDACQETISMAGTLLEHWNHVTIVVAKTVVQTSCKP